MLSTHAAVEHDKQATREVLAAINDTLARHFLDRVTAMEEGGTKLSDKELQQILALLKQNGINAPSAESGSISDQARAAGKLQFGALAEKRKVVPFRRLAVEQRDGPGQAEGSETGV